MSSAGLQLQAAVLSKLLADTSVVAALGGPRVFDDVPQRAGFPYVTFGQSTERDWSTGSDDGNEHFITLHVWSRGRGRKEAETVLSLARAALHDAALDVSGHRLVNFRHEFSEVRREVNSDSFHAVARFRAVTEVL